MHLQVQLLRNLYTKMRLMMSNEQRRAPDQHSCWTQTTKSLFQAQLQKKVNKSLTLKWTVPLYPTQNVEKENMICMHLSKNNMKIF